MANEYIFHRHSGGIASITAEAASVMRSHAQVNHRTPEAGGLLLGRLIANTADIVVDCATTPTLEDRASRFRFFRAKRPANKYIQEQWIKSSGTCNYLGEWHTHPEDDPTPSCVDNRNWKRIAKKSTFEQDSLLFVIVGRTELRVWEFSIRERSLHLLKMVE